MRYPGFTFYFQIRLVPPLHHGDTSTLRGSLSLVMRTCWTQAPEDRPEFTEVVGFLEQRSAPTGPPLQDVSELENKTTENAQPTASAA
jgi:hypothetical protein